MDDDNNLLGRIYDAALDRDLWPEVLDGLRQLVGCQAGGLLHAQVAPLRVTAMGVTGFEPAMADRISELFADPDDNPFLRKLPTLIPGTPISRQQLVNDEEFERGRIYNDFFKPMDLYHDVTTPMVLWHGEAVGMFLSRPKSAGAMDQDDIRVLKPWIPHLQRSLQIYSELGMQRVGFLALSDLLDQISNGVALVRPDGRVMAMNAAMEQMVAAGDGLTLENGRLGLQRGLARGGLEDAVACAVSGGGAGSLLIGRPSGKRAYPAFVLPLPRTASINGTQTAVAAVLVSDPDGDMEPHARAAARLYGLSPMETTVAIEIAKGAGRTAVALALGISRHTVKTHLGRIFEKTSAQGQVELARIMGATSILQDGADQ